MAKSDKDDIKEENCRPIPLTDIDAKSLTKYKQTKSNNTLKGSHTMIKRDLSQGCKDF